MNVLVTRGQTSRKPQKSVLNLGLPLTLRSGQTAGVTLHSTELVSIISGLSKCVFFSRKPRGVRSKRIRQKERLVRDETPPRAAGGGPPGENMRTKAEDETRDSG